MRNGNIETAKLACFLNSLKPSLIRVVRRKKIERTKRKIGMAAARKAMILKIIVRCQCRVYLARSTPLPNIYARIRPNGARSSIRRTLRSNECRADALDPQAVSLVLEMLLARLSA